MPAISRPNFQPYLTPRRKGIGIPSVSSFVRCATSSCYIPRCQIKRFTEHVAGFFHLTTEMGEKEHHVHFGGGSGVGKDNNIMIHPQRHGHLDAHLGFLQLHHRYHIEFSIPWNLCLQEEGKTLAPAVIVDNPNPNCRIIDFAHDKDGLRLKVELLAYKEKLLKEEIQVMCCKSGTPLKILLNARVLGKGKGTPLLRNGIRSVAIEGDDDDEVSDWTGFNSQD